MKASIRLVTNQKITENGFPIWCILQDGKLRTYRVIGHSHKQHWDPVNRTITKNHPNYNELLFKIMEMHTKCITVNFSDLTFDQAAELLFNMQTVSEVLQFKAAALKTLTGKSTSINKTVLNSFDAFAPKILIQDITPQIAQNYMKWLLAKNKPNGVHTYLRKLSTLFTRVSDLPNPFAGVRPKKQATQKKNLTDADLIKLINTQTYVNKSDYKSTTATINSYRHYYLLMFYLGGIDMVDLAQLRYDKHVFGGRIQFKRHKGGTDAFVNNKIFPEALEILKNFDCKPYLVPIYQNENYKEFVNNMNRRFALQVSDLNLSRKPLTKSARYTFINRAQQLLIDQRITMEIVGHVQQDTHSIYTDHFPLSVRDAAHERIIRDNL